MVHIVGNENDSSTFISNIESSHQENPTQNVNADLFLGENELAPFRHADTGTDKTLDSYAKSVEGTNLIPDPLDPETRP